VTSYNDLGRIAETLGDVDKALEYYLKSMALAEETGYTRGYIGVLNNVGPLYTKKNYSKGLEYLRDVK
jgi:tetratricopeptide (TPR) repeat protein